MRSDDDIEADVEFIFAEFTRFALMPWGELRNHLKENAFHDLKDAKGRRRILGRAASKRLFVLTEETLAASAFSGRVDPQRAFDAVRKGFGDSYLREGLGGFTGAQFRLDLAAWVSGAGEACSPRTHFVPCEIGLEDAHPIAWGPVRLQSWRSGRDDFQKRLASYVSADDRTDDHRRTTAEGVNAYYAAFRDIAEVVVPSCDKPTSKRAAADAVQLVVDVLHVLAGAGFTERMRIGGPPISDVRSEITIDPDGQVAISRSSRGGGAFISEQAWADLSSPRFAPHADAIAMMLTAIVERRELPLLASRFLDGCAWFGDGSREASSAAAIVKFLTAMERLLWAGEKGPGVTKRIADRAAALTFSTDLWNMEEIAAEVREAYGARSAVLHGRLAKADPELRRLNSLCERVSRDLLLTWLERYGSHFAEETSLEHLRVYFDGLVESARAECEHRRTGAGELAPAE